MARARRPIWPTTIQRNTTSPPRCYIKRWARPDGKVVEFKRRTHGRVEARPTATKGTGYRRNLYTVPGAAPGRQNLVESRYLRRVDTEASLSASTRRLAPTP